MKLAKAVVKNILYRSPLARYITHRYQYMFSPAQLCFLSSCVDKTATIEGAIVEVGCFTGQTTVWLSKHMEFSGINKSYIAIDTFSGFLEKDVEYEMKARGKAREILEGFSFNSKQWFDKKMVINGVHNVTSFQADAGKFAYASLGLISFALIDVDLYLPVKQALERIYPQMAPGSIIVVDDCLPDQTYNYDGALQAYIEFTNAHRLPHQFVLKKLGVIEVKS